jgi:hypothetical protein
MGALDQFRFQLDTGPTTVEILLPKMCALVHILERPTDDGLEVAQGAAQVGLLAAGLLQLFSRKEFLGRVVVV